MMPVQNDIQSIESNILLLGGAGDKQTILKNTPKTDAPIIS